MRLPILAAAAAVTLGACQPAAEPQPVDAEPTPDASATVSYTHLRAHET